VIVDRRGFIASVVLGLCVSKLVVAQQARVYRVGFLSAGPRPADGLAPAELRKTLLELGYSEGKNVVYACRWAEAARERLPGMAAELVAEKVDVIVTTGYPATVAAKDASSTIPIVMSSPGDPVGVGLIASLARPGGNITGMSDSATVLSAKRLEILKETVPAAARIAVLWNMQDQAMSLRYREIDRAARVLGVTVQPLGVREPDDFERAFAAMNRERPDAIFMVTDSLTRLNRKRVMEYAEAHRIPAMYEFEFLVRDGGLISYGPSFADLYQQAAIYVDKILKGAKPGELPVSQPTRYYLAVNLKTAKALGLTIPQSLLLRADEVVE
jgi:putative ABC transport system substrate-binding protein